MSRISISAIRTRKTGYSPNDSFLPRLIRPLQTRGRHPSPVDAFAGGARALIATGLLAAGLPIAVESGPEPLPVAAASDPGPATITERVRAAAGAACRVAYADGPAPGPAPPAGRRCGYDGSRPRTPAGRRCGYDDRRARALSGRSGGAVARADAYPRSHSGRTPLVDAPRRRADAGRSHRARRILRRVVVSYAEPVRSGQRPVLLAVADGRCRIVRPATHILRGWDAACCRAPGKRPGADSTRGAPEPPGARGVESGAVRVALVDSGVNYLLPEIASRLARDVDGTLVGFDFWDLDTRPFDSNPARSAFHPQRHGRAPRR